MDIGQRLKEARKRAKITQEIAAERIGVSRQTISNWENNRSYPDILYVIDLSRLYDISLDELLKEDEKMMAYLAESTDVVKSRKALGRRLLLLTDLLIWTGCILIFWLGAKENAMGYSILFLHIVFPVVIFVSSIFVGKDDGWNAYKWLMLLFFGVLYMLVPYATFSMANMRTFDKVNLPQLSAMLPGILCAAAGIAAGTLVERRKKRRESQKDQRGSFSRP
ncbi:hypothetical protein B5F13_02505 [Drancourtella sp. An177]|nr:hypothetical protein B5F13_02505 [Drancourtella sp. An177]